MGVKDFFKDIGESIDDTLKLSEGIEQIQSKGIKQSIKDTPSIVGEKVKELDDKTLKLREGAEQIKEKGIVQSAKEVGQTLDIVTDLGGRAIEEKGKEIGGVTGQVVSYLGDVAKDPLTAEIKVTVDAGDKATDVLGEYLKDYSGSGIEKSIAQNIAGNISGFVSNPIDTTKEVAPVIKDSITEKLGVVSQLGKDMFYTAGKMPEYFRLGLGTFGSESNVNKNSIYGKDKLKELDNLVSLYTPLETKDTKQIRKEFENVSTGDYYDQFGDLVKAGAIAGKDYVTGKGEFDDYIKPVDELKKMDDISNIVDPGFFETTGGAYKRVITDKIYDLQNNVNDTESKIKTQLNNLQGNKDYETYNKYISEYYKETQNFKGDLNNQQEQKKLQDKILRKIGTTEDIIKNVSTNLNTNESFNRLNELSKVKEEQIKEYEDFTTKVFNVKEGQTGEEFMEEKRKEKELEYLSNNLNKIGRVIKTSIEEDKGLKEMKAKNPGFATSKEGEKLFEKIVDMSVEDVTYAVGIKDQIEGLIGYNKDNDTILITDYKKLLEGFDARKKYSKRVYETMAELRQQKKYRNMSADKLMNIADDRVNIMLTEEEKESLSSITDLKTKFQGILKMEGSMREYAKSFKNLSEGEFKESFSNAGMGVLQTIYSTATAVEYGVRKATDKVSSYGATIVPGVELEAKELERQAQIAREVRTLRYTYDTYWESIPSMLFYNTNSIPGILATTFGGSAIGSGITRTASGVSSGVGTALIKGGEKLTEITPRGATYLAKATEALSSIAATKAPVLLGTINTGVRGLSVFGRGLYDTTTKASSMIVESVTSGVTTNPIFDRLGGDAASKEQMLFNMTTDIVFDFGFDTVGAVKGWALKKGYQGGSSYFFNKVFKEGTESAAALDNFIKHYYQKTGLKITRKQGIQLFREGELSLKSIGARAQRDYLSRGELYNFVSDSLRVANETKIKKFIDGGIGVEVSDILGKKIDTEDLLYSVHKNMTQKGISDVNKKVYSQIIDNEIKTIKNFVAGKGIKKENRIWRDLLMDYKGEGAAETRASLIKQVEQLENNKGKKAFYKEVDKLMDNLVPAIRKFSNQNEQVILYDTVTNNKISIGIKDLEKMKGKDFSEIVADGIIDLKFVDDKVRKEVKVPDVATEGSLYSFTSNKTSNKQIKDIVSLPDITEKINKLKEGLSKAKYIDDKGKVSDKFYSISKVEKNINEQLSKAINGEYAYTTPLSKTNLSKDEIEELSRQEIGIFEDAMRAYYGDELIAKTPIDLGVKSLSGDKIIQTGLDKDAYFSFAFGSPGEKNFKEYKNKIAYLLPGKKLEHNSFIKGLSNKAKVNIKDKSIIKQYIEGSSNIIKKLESYGKFNADGYIDVESAIKYLNIEDVGETFEETMNVIKNSFKDVGEKEFKRFDEVSKFLKDNVFEGDVVDDNILKNFAYNYFGNIDKIKKFFDEAIPDKEFESVLGRMLMSDTIVDGLSKTVKSPYSKKIKETLRIEYENNISKHESAIQLRKQDIKKIEKELRDLGKYRSRGEMDEYLKALKKDLRLLVKNKKNIEKEGLDGFIKARTQLYTNETNLKRINNYRQTIARDILLNEERITKSKTYKAYEDLLEKEKKRDIIKDEGERLIKRMENIKKKAELGTLDILKEIKGTKDAKYYSQAYKDFITSYLDNLAKPDAGLTDINYNKLKENIQNRVDGVFNYEQAKENNPVYKEFYDGIIRSDVNESNKVYVDNFNKEFGIKKGETLLDSYNKSGSKLNKFIDNLYFDDKKLNKILNESSYSKGKVVTPKEVKKEVDKELREMLTKVMGDKKTYAMVDGKKTNITDELIDDILKDGKLRKQFKRIKRLNTEGSFSLSKAKEGFSNKSGKYIEYDTTKVSDIGPQEVPIMWNDIKKNSNGNFKYITGADTKNVSKLLTGGEVSKLHKRLHRKQVGKKLVNDGIIDKGQGFSAVEKISSMDKLIYYTGDIDSKLKMKQRVNLLLGKDLSNENKIKVFNGNKDIRKECFGVLDEIEKYRFIIDTINGKRNNKELRDTIRKKLGLGKGEIYMGGFGDKSGFGLIYSNKKLKLGKERKKEIIETSLDVKINIDKKDLRIKNKKKKYNLLTSDGKEIEVEGLEIKSNKIGAEIGIVSDGVNGLIIGITENGTELIEKINNIGNDVSKISNKNKGLIKEQIIFRLNQNRKDKSFLDRFGIEPEIIKKEIKKEVTTGSKKITPENYGKIIEDLGFIDYAISAGFKNNDLLKNNVDDLLKNTFSSYDDFRKKVIELEIPLGLQQGGLPKWEGDKIVYGKNKADEWGLAQAIANIRKREASYTSTHSLFDDVKGDVDLYVVKEIIDETQFGLTELRNFDKVKNELNKILKKSIGDNKIYSTIYGNKIDVTDMLIDNAINDNLYKRKEWIKNKDELLTSLNEFKSISKYETNPEYLLAKDRYNELSSVDLERYGVDTPEGIEYTMVLNNAGYNPDVDDNRSALLNYYDALRKKYGTDLEDGTSHASQNLGDELAIINGKDKLNEIKTHIAGSSNGENFLGKNLINFGDLKEGDKVLKDTVLIGESSAKLNGGYKPYKEKEQKIIERYNPETKQYDKYQVLGKVDNANKSWFKNAAEEGDSYEDITINDSVIIKYGPEYQDSFKAVQMQELENLFETFKTKLTEKEIGQLGYGDLNAFIQNVTSGTGIGKFSDEVIQSKVDTFLSEASQIINKNRGEGQSFYHYKCSHDVTPNEIGINKNSKLFKQLENNQKKIIKDLNLGIEELKSQNKSVKKLQEQLIEAERVLKESDYQVVAIRYPVSNKYNPGTFQIRIFDNISDHAIITNPETAYLKLESDSDGDHIFVSGIHDKYTNIIARALENIPLSKQQIDLTSKYDKFFNPEIITPGTHKALVESIKEKPSRFIMVDQVEKGKLKKASKASIVDSRNAALEAKYNIGVVQATIRTFNILRYHAEKINTITDNIKLKRYLDTINPNIKSLLNIGTGGEINRKNLREFINRFDDDFHRDSASITQLTIDFGNSGKDSFDKDWYNPLVERLFKTTDVEKKADIMNKVGTISTSYNTEFLGSIPKANNSRQLRDALGNLSGNKKELYNHLESMYRPIHDSIMFTSSEKFLLNRLLEGNMAGKKSTVSQLKERFVAEYGLRGGYFNSYSSGDNYIDDLIYLSKGQKEWIQDVLLKDPIVKSAVTKKGGIEKLLKSGNLKKEQRYKLALYSKTLTKDQGQEFKKLHGDKILGMADYLNDSDLVEYIKYAEEKRSKRVIDSKILEGKTEQDIETMYKEAIEHSKNFEPALEKEKELLDNEIQILNEEINKRLEKIKIPEFAAEKKTLDLFNILQKNTSIQEPKGIYLSFFKPEFNEEILTEIMGVSNYLQTTRDKCIARKWITDVKRTNPEIIQRLSKIENLYMQMGVVELRRKSLVYQGAIGSRVDKVLSGKRFGNLFGNSNRADYIIDMINSVVQDGIGIEEGKYVLPSIEDIKKGMIDRMNEEVRAYGSDLPIFNDDLFNSRLKEYYDDSLTKIVNIMNVTQDKFPGEINFLREYKGKGKYYKEKDKTARTSLIEDILNSIKGDHSLLLNSFGLNTKEKVVDYFAKIGDKIDLSRGQTLYSLMVRKENDKVGNFLGFFHNLYYSARYTLPSLFLGAGGIMAGMTQVTGQLLETRTLIANTGLAVEAEAVNKRFGLLSMENTLGFEISGLESTENAIAKHVGLLYQEKLPMFARRIREGKLGQYDIINKIFSDKNLENTVTTLNAINQVINNSLAAFDAPMDHSRRIASTASVMERLGIKSYEDFVIRAESLGKVGREEFLARFSSEARIVYNDLGGGVSSKDALYKANKLTFNNAYGNEGGMTRYLFQTWNSGVGFLGNWGINKVLSRIEDAGQVFTGLNYLLGITKERSLEQAMNNFKDVYRSFTYQARLLTTITALGLKIEQYNKDVDDKTNISDFVRSMHNTLVGFDILTGVYIDSFKDAQALDLGTGDTIGYVSSKAITRYFRTLQMIDVGNEIIKYHDYLPDDYEGNKWWESIDQVLHNFSAVFAVNSGLEFSEDIGNKYGNSMGISMLGLGSFTEYERLEDEFAGQRSAATYESKGFVKTLIDFFNIRDRTIIGENRAFFDIINKVREDENVKKLESNGIGDLENQYDFTRYTGKIGDKITEEQKLNIEELDKYIGLSGETEVADDGGKVKTIKGEPAYFGKIDKIRADILRSLANIEGEGVNKGFTKGKMKEAEFRRYINKKRNDLKGERSKSSYKNLLFRSHESGITTSEVLNFLYTEDLKQRKIDYANENSKPDPYELEPEINLQLKRESLIKHKDLFNNDAGLMGIILGGEVRANHKDVIDSYSNLDNDDKNKIINSIKQEGEIYKIMTDDVKAGKDTAKYYRNKLAEATRYVVDSDKGALVLKNAFKAMMFSGMSNKDKVTMLTASVNFISDKNFNRLRDDEKFMNSIYPFNRAVVNLAYSLDKTAYDFDSGTLANQFGNAAYGKKTNKSGKRKGSSYFKPKYNNGRKTSYGAGGRPNFSKTTEPLKQFIKDNEDLLDRDPIAYTNRVQNYVKENLFNINPFRFGPMKEYGKYVLQRAVDEVNKNEFGGIKEAGLTQTRKQEKLETMKYKFKEKKAPKIEKIKYRPKVKYGRARTNLISDLPFNYTE